MHSCRNCFMESMNDIYNITFIYLIFTRNKHRVDGQFHVELTFAFENLDYYWLDLSIQPYPRSNQFLSCQLFKKKINVRPCVNWEITWLHHNENSIFQLLSKNYPYFEHHRYNLDRSYELRIHPMTNQIEQKI